jgi:hypothetical protein
MKRKTSAGLPSVHTPAIKVTLAPLVIFDLYREAKVLRKRRVEEVGSATFSRKAAVR